MKLFICFSVLLVASVSASGSGTPSISTPGGGGYLYPVPAVRSPLLLGSFGSFDSSLISPIQQQYHNQDSLGQYSYGYTEPLSSKQEVRTLDGVTRGSYSYRDADNKLQTVDYVADAGGFRVAATNLPQAPQPAADLVAPQPVVDTPEVAAARAQHLAAYREVETRLEMARTSPRPVEETAPAMTKMVPMSMTSSLSSSSSSSSVPSSSPSSSSSSSPSSSAAPSSLDLLPRPVEDTAEVAAAKVEFFSRYAEEEKRHQLLRAHRKPAIIQPVVVRAQPVAAVPLSYQAISIPTAGYNFKYVAVPERSYLPVH